VQCEVTVPDKARPAISRTIGIDLGLDKYAMTFDGMDAEKIEHPKNFKKMLRKLRRDQRRMSRRVKRSANWNKALRVVRSQHYKVACKRRDFIQQETTRLAKTKPDAKFVVEDLNIKGMMANHKLARAIADSAWAEFVRVLTYKVGAERIVKADRWFPSSKMCSSCGVVNHGLRLKDRTFVCPVCGLVIDRDLNAAINLSRYEQYIADGVYRPRSRRELPASSAGSNVCGEERLEAASAKQKPNTMELIEGLRF
jgi:putative transposase